MRKLVIDCATEACSVALIEDGSLLAGTYTMLGRGHAERLVPMISELPGKGRADIIAVDVGPGSFTGLRVGISAARGIGMAANKDVVGVTTLSAYAAPLVAEQTEFPVVTAIDARHDHVYFQTVAGNGTPLIRPCVVPVNDTFRAARFGAVRIVGNAAHILAERWPSQMDKPSLVEAKPGPDIGWVALLGAAADPARAAATPFYLRPPDAKPKSDPLHAGLPQS